MSNVNHLRNSLISRIMAIKDKDVLSALDKLLEKASEGQMANLTNEQKAMLQMSEDDVKYGRTISQDELFRRERQWLEVN